MEATRTQVQSDIDRLEHARRELLEEVEHLRADLRHMAEPSADEADADAYEREKTWALVQGLERKVESIDRAIRAARNGTYGICESCSERIDPARLEILPETTLCLNCKRQLERRNRIRR
jgi:RNA polymerase-binding protein DksA